MVSRATILRVASYGIFATVSLALIILLFFKNPAEIGSFWIIYYAMFLALLFVIQNRRSEGKGTRVFDTTLVGLILMALFFLGSVALLIDIPIFNYVEPVVIYGCYIGRLLGLVLGYFAGKFYTKKQLEILNKNNEFRGVGSTKLEATVLLVLTGFVLICFFSVYLDLKASELGLIPFAISGTFALFAARLFQVRDWEYNAGKLLMMTNKRFYVEYKNLPSIIN
jgi:hypothetical protein